MGLGFGERTQRSVWKLLTKFNGTSLSQEGSFRVSVYSTDGSKELFRIITINILVEAMDTRGERNSLV